MDKLKKICVEERRALERMKRDFKIMRMELERIQKITPSLLKSKAHIIRPPLTLEKDVKSAQPGHLSDIDDRTTTTVSSSLDMAENIDDDCESGFWTGESTFTDDCTLPSTASLPLYNGSSQYRHDIMGINNNPGRHTNRFAYVFTDESFQERNHKPTYADQKAQVRMRKAERLCESIEQLRLKREQLMYPKISKSVTKSSVSKTIPKITLNPTSDQTIQEKVEENISISKPQPSGMRKPKVQIKIQNYNPQRRVSKLCGIHLKPATEEDG